MKTNWVFAIFSLLSIVVCGGCATDKTALTKQVIDDFNGGHLEKALTGARALRGAEGDFLVGQIMVFTAMGHGGAFSLLKPQYEHMVDLDPLNANEHGSARFLAAKVFARIYWGGRDKALIDLTDGCSRLNFGLVGECVSILVKDARTSYLSSRNNMDRVYLMEMSSISRKLSVGGGDSSDFDFGISFIGVDNSRAASVIRDMERRGVLDQEQRHEYCNLARLITGADRSLCK